MSIVAVQLVRERDFAEFVREAPEEELLREHSLIKEELYKLDNYRTPTTELLRDRLGTIAKALDIAA